MSQGISLIVGLGNPGEKYANTRHNAGFRFLDTVLNQFDGQMRNEGRFGAEVARLYIGSSEVWLLAPTEFMNLSGNAVGKFARFYKIMPENVLVVHDEIDLPPGIVRLKSGGGHGGHNGLRDVIPKLGSKDFWRLRIGVGHPGEASQVAGFVLKNAPASEAALTESASDDAARLIEDIVNGDYQKVMNTLHTDNAN